MDLLQKLRVAPNCLCVFARTMLAVSQIVVEHVVGGVQSDGLLEFLYGFLVQPLRLIIYCQSRMQLLQRVLVMNVLLSKLLTDDLVVFDGFLAFS